MEKVDLPVDSVYSLSAEISKSEEPPTKLFPIFLSNLFWVLEVLSGVAIYRHGFFRFDQTCYGSFWAFIMRIEKEEEKKMIPVNIFLLISILPVAACVFLGLFAFEYIWMPAEFFCHRILFSIIVVTGSCVLSLVLASIRRAFEYHIDCNLKTSFLQKQFHKSVTIVFAPVRRFLHATRCLTPSESDSSSPEEEDYSILVNEKVPEKDDLPDEEIPKTVDAAAAVDSVESTV